MELHIDVLRAIYNGRKSPSRVVYAANLSYDRVTQCITFLEEQKLIRRIDDKKKKYEATKRGIEVLQYFSEIANSLFNNKKGSPDSQGQYIHELPLMR